MPQDLSRRSFLTTTAITAAGAAACSVANPLISLAADAPNPATAPTTAPATQEKKLNIGIIGTGGQGMDHVRAIHAIDNANVIAVCDVDALMLVNSARHIPKAQPFTDYRELLKLKNLEAVVIATPDHSHAYITAAALRAGKHVYCEKPLCHTIKEVRAIAALAEQTKLVTQMGIQIHALENYRRVVEIVRSGAIGKVNEVHIWNERKPRPVTSRLGPPPASLNYDLWLQPLPDRPFRADYHPYNWRGFWTFSEGMLGDIGCHLMDVAFWSLDLTYPTHIEAEGARQTEDDRKNDLVPDWLIARYDFPERGDHPAVKLTWYDHPKLPEKHKDWDLDPTLKDEAVMFIGDQGMLAANYTARQLLPREKFKDFKSPTTTIAPSPRHQQDWINACLKNDPTACGAPFSYGAKLTETAILGTLAFRAGKPLDWDHANMRISNAPEAESLLDYHYRDSLSL